VSRLGLALVLIGGLLLAAGRLNLPLGRLPGDFLYRGKNATFYFPLATSIVLSIVVSAILMLLGRMKR
jgi:Protein of unknown function (DUF2905)